MLQLQLAEQQHKLFMERLEVDKNELKQNSGIEQAHLGEKKNLFSGENIKNQCV